jgi:CRP-like cAMP-binding protein
VNSGNIILNSLPADEQRLLKPHLLSCVLTPGQRLLDVGRPVEDVYFPNSGLISLGAAADGGEAVAAAMVGKESVIGAGYVMADLPSLVRATVYVKGGATKIGARELRSILARAPQLQAVVIRFGQIILGVSQQTVMCNVLHDIPSRFARWLLRARDLQGSTFTFTQQDVADIMGVQRASISLTASTFQQAGLISYKRGQITVTDVEALRARACECYHRSQDIHEHLAHGPAHTFERA